MDPTSLRIVSFADAVIKRYYALSQPTPEFETSIAELVTKVEKFLSEQLKEEIRLDIFGSLKSGFGSLDSDIDVCLRFIHDEQPEDVVMKKIMFSVASSLQLEKDYIKSAVPIVRTKVPIVKCEILAPWETSMDISYYNTLALENTRLLATYCQWEPERLPQLGLWVKKWAKEGGICDASLGYLSSYGCILLLIHYLQKCDPPVLPHLQEDYGQVENLHSSGWNTYFYPVVESNWSRNTKSVGELFLGFLDYYTNFNFKETVVQIRQKYRITKADKKEKEKNWQGRKAVLAIEDPFELERNLCGGLLTMKFKRITMYFERSAKEFRATIDSEDIAADDVDFKLHLDDVLKKCHVSNEETKTKKKEKEGGGEDGKKNGAGKESTSNIGQRYKNRLTGAGSAVNRQTKFQQAAMKEMEALLQAMYLQKENFPPLMKEVQKKNQNSSAGFWKNCRADWKNGTNDLKKFRGEQQQKKLNSRERAKKQKALQANFQQTPYSNPQRRTLQQVQPQKNFGPAKKTTPQEERKANTNPHPQQPHLQKPQNKAQQPVHPQKNGPMKANVSPQKQAPPKLSKAERKAHFQAREQKNVFKKKAKLHEANNAQSTVPQQLNLTKAQRRAMNNAMPMNDGPAQKAAPQQAQKKQKSAQEPPSEQKNGERGKKKKSKNAATSLPPPVAAKASHAS